MCQKYGFNSSELWNDVLLQQITIWHLQRVFSKKWYKLLLPYFYCTGSCKSTLKNYSCGGTVAHAIDINQKCLDAFLEIFKHAKKHII